MTEENITLTGELVQLSPPMVRVSAATRSGLVVASARGPLEELERLRDEVLERAREAMRKVEDDGAE